MRHVISSTILFLAVPFTSSASVKAVHCTGGWTTESSRAYIHLEKVDGSLYDIMFGRESTEKNKSGLKPSQAIRFAISSRRCEFSAVLAYAAFIHENTHSASLFVCYSKQDTVLFESSLKLYALNGGGSTYAVTPYNYQLKKHEAIDLGPEESDTSMNFSLAKSFGCSFEYDDQ